MLCAKSAARNCQVPAGITLNSSHFLTRPNKKGQTRTTATCIFCRSIRRKTHDVLPPTPPSNRRTAPPRTPDNNGLTPSSHRARHSPARPVSPSPQRVAPVGLRAASTRIRRAPVLPYDTPPTPPTPPPPSRTPSPLPPRAPRQNQLCNVCRKNLPLAMFINPRTELPEFQSCDNCRQRQRDKWAARHALEEPPPLSQDPSSQNSTQWSHYPDLPQEMDQPTPPPLPSGLDDPCIGEEAIGMVDCFREALEGIIFEVCLECNEGWYNMNLRDGVCQHCRSGIQGKWTAANGMDPGPDLCALCMADGHEPPEIPTQVEEMILSKAHVQMSMWRIGGRQTKYSGHTIVFPRDTVSLFEKLPLLPRDLQVVVIRSRSTEQNHAFGTRMDFTVRRQVVLDNLIALKRYHRSYSNVEIDYVALALLPENGSVFEQLPFTNAADEDTPEEHDVPLNASTNATRPANEIDPDFLPGALVPDLPNPQLEEELVEQALRNLIDYGDVAGPATEPPPPQSAPPVLTAPELRATPIDEYRDSSDHLIDAFPFLFPSGKGGPNSTRTNDVREHKYYRHLMRYKDGRFAKHPRFRYYAFNSSMRHTAKKKAFFFKPRSAGELPLTTADVSELSEFQFKQLSLEIYRAGACLRGTSAYWVSRSRDLQAMVRQIGTPSVFFTLSAADIQWDDLHRLMPNRLSGPESEQMRQRRTAANVNDNPAIAAWYFHHRFLLFLKHVMYPLFGIKDHWFRYEWQSRGSSHVHALFWSAAPSPDSINIDTNEGVQTFLDYWSQHMTAFNPDVSKPPSLRHPSSIPLSDLTFTNRELAQLINRVQRHTMCSEAYCMRRPKGGGNCPKKCRFNYPKPERSEAVLMMEGRTVKMYAKRNDELLNEYNPTVLIAWRANTDFGVISDRGAVIGYIAKYVSKCEQPSSDFAKVMDTTTKYLDGDVAARTLYQKMMGKLLVERDWSAQEVMHLLLECPAYGSTRSFEQMNLAPRYGRLLRTGDPENTEGDEDGTLESTGWRDKYPTRPESAQAISLYEWVKEWASSTARGSEGIRRLKVPKIIKLYPAYNPLDPDSDSYQLWCRAKLLLHHPHRNEETLDILLDGEPWSDAYERCLSGCTHADNDTLPTRFRMDTDGYSSESSYSTNTTVSDNAEREDFMHMAAQGPRRGGDGTGSHLDQLGKRDLDVNNNWREDAEFWGDEGMGQRIGYLEEARKLPMGPLEKPPIHPDSLNTQQRWIYDKVERHRNADLAGLDPMPFLLNVDGTAGTGKSFLIDAITQLLAASSGTQPLIRRLAPTGVAAFNIDGETYHSALGIRPNANPDEIFMEPVAGRLRVYQDSWEKVKYLIIDEKSMIGASAMAQIDFRLRCITGQREKPFGGLSVLLVGDFGQLPPVADNPIYSKNQGTPASGLGRAKLYGRNMFLQFQETIVLGQVMRQADTDPVTEQFKATLSRLRTGTLDLPGDHDLLSTRCYDRVSISDRNLFEESTLLAGKNDTVNTLNLNKLYDSAHPVLICPARHSGKAAAKGTDEEAEDLKKIIFVMKGAKVMITRNLWTAAGLTNGTMATVEEIGFRPIDQPGQTLPAVIMVSCPSYRGPTLWRTASDIPIIPLIPVTATWKKGTEQNSRTQYPLRLAYAMTIHKSQGMTLDRARIDLGKSEILTGMTFVALSRVKRLDGLLFVNGLTSERLTAAGRRTPTRIRVEEDEERRMSLPFIIDPILYPIP